MIATCVHVWVKKECIEAFKKASEKNHLNSIKEPGNMRFDICQDANDPQKFLLYEAYSSESAAVAHKDTAHYNEWRETVADMMDKPREGVKHNVLFPR